MSPTMKINIKTEPRELGRYEAPNGLHYYVVDLGLQVGYSTLPLFALIRRLKNGMSSKRLVTNIAHFTFIRYRTNGK